MACACIVFDTVQLLRSLEFIIHPDKLVLDPTRRIQYLGFIIDSELMIVILTPERASNMISWRLNWISNFWARSSRERSVHILHSRGVLNTADVSVSSLKLSVYETFKQ